MGGMRQGIPGPEDFQESPETMVRRVVREELAEHTRQLLDWIRMSGITSYELLENGLEAEKSRLDRLLDRD